MQRTNIYFEDGQLKALRLLAASRGESVATVVRDAVDSYIKSTMNRDEIVAQLEDAIARVRSRIPETIEPDEIEADITAAWDELQQPVAMRAVIDTNVWVSAVLNPQGRPAEVVRLFEQGAFTVVTSEPLINELVEVLSRRRFRERYGVAESDIRRITEPIMGLADIIEPPGIVRICRDPDDDIVLETATFGRANALVSRDEDVVRAPELLLVLPDYGVEILTVERFLQTII